MVGRFSALGPVDPAPLPPIDGEKEKEAPWIVRKLVGVSGKSLMIGISYLRLERKPSNMGDRGLLGARLVVITL
jgi:hypothetical protein